MEMEEDIFGLGDLEDDELFDLFKAILGEMETRGLSQIARANVENWQEDVRLKAEYIRERAKAEAMQQNREIWDSEAQKLAAEAQRQINEAQQVLNATIYRVAIAWLEQTAPELTEALKPKPSLSMWSGGQGGDLRVYFDIGNGKPPWERDKKTFAKVTYHHTGNRYAPPGSVKVEMFPSEIGSAIADDVVRSVGERMKHSAEHWAQFCVRAMDIYPGAFKLYADKIPTTAPCDAGVLRELTSILGVH